MLVTSARYQFERRGPGGPPPTLTENHASHILHRIRNYNPILSFQNDLTLNLEDVNMKFPE